MSRFESFLAQQFEDYMAYRHQLGYDTHSLRWVLKTVDRYLVAQNADPSDLTPAFFLTLRANLLTQYKSIFACCPPHACSSNTCCEYNTARIIP